MSLHARFATRAGIVCGALAVAIAALSFAPTASRADETRKYGNALDWAPADSAFYSSSLRNKEQLDNIAHSKAWAKFTDLSSIRQVWQSMQMILSLPGSPLSAIQQALQQPENQQLVEMVGDLASSEIVFYGDVHAVELMQLGSRAMNTARFSSAFNANGPGGPDPEAQRQTVARDLLRMLQSNVDKLETPTLVIGFKHSNAERVTAQLARLEKLITEGIESAPPLKGRFERRKVGSGEYLVLNLDGKMVPWDEIPLKEVEKNPGEFDKLIEKLKRLTLCVSIGVRGDYLLVSIGPSTDHLANLGNGKLLVSRPEFQPLAKFAGERLTAIHFASKQARIATDSSETGLSGLLDALRGVLPTSPLPKETQQRIDGDLERLTQSMQSATEHLGPTFGVSFLTPRGYESYSYDWSEHDGAKGSKRLDLVEHVGGTPLVAVVSRSKVSPDDYRQLIAIVKMGHGYFEELALPQMRPNEQAQYREIMEFAGPLLKRLDAATEKMLLPGLADGQTAFVLDAKLTSRQWFKAMPRSAAPLPMLEPALVFGVSDPDLVKKAFGEYRAVADAIVAKIKQTEPQSLPPDFKLPDPQMRENKNGAIYSYPFAKELGLDPQLALNAGLGKHVAVLSFAPKHTGELLATTPFEAEGPAGDTKRPLVAIGYLDSASIVEAATPWIDYAVRQYYAERTAGDNGAGAADGMRSTLSEVHSVLEVLQVLRTVSSATYVEDKATVTHSETHYQDLK
jgi:hypothetical protein